MTMQIQTLQHFANNCEDLSVSRAAICADQLTTDLRRLSSPFRVRLRLLTEHGCYVTQAQGPRTFGKQSRCGARDQRRNVRSDRQHAAISVGESESMMRLRVSHAVLKERIIINGWRRDLLVRPTAEDRYQRILDLAPESRFRPKVITHPGRNPGKWFRHDR